MIGFALHLPIFRQQDVLHKIVVKIMCTIYTYCYSRGSPVHVCICVEIMMAFLQDVMKGVVKKG